MAGIYVHIPFCKSRCRYCDFFSSTLLEHREEYVEAVLCEAERRKDYLHGEDVRTLYIGGGTPSMLTDSQLERLVTTLLSFAKRISRSGESPLEVTMEANPGDITKERVAAWKAWGVNRLSIGIQSFNDKLLQTIGRRHNAEEARQAVKAAKEGGITNLSIDLMYGLPGETMADWQEDVQQALALDVPHLSAYSLIYEEGTMLTKMREAGQIAEVDEDLQNEMYDYLVNTLKINNIEQYEVSNFSRPDYRSQHNSSYWANVPYLGLGAGAHSYDGNSRQWNLGDLQAYLKGDAEQVAEREELTEEDKWTEQVMLRMRTVEGLDLTLLSPKRQEQIRRAATSYIRKGLLHEQDGRLTATLAGMHILNRIIEDLLEEGE